MLDADSIWSIAIAVGLMLAGLSIYLIVSGIKENIDYRKQVRKSKEQYEIQKYEHEMEKVWNELLNAIGGRR